MTDQKRIERLSTVNRCTWCVLVQYQTSLDEARQSLMNLQDSYAKLEERATKAEEASATMQDDLAALLRALGLGDHARPQSPHEVMREAIAYAAKIIEEKRRLRKLAERLSVWPCSSYDEDHARDCLRTGHEPRCAGCDARALLASPEGAPAPQPTPSAQPTTEEQ